MNSMKKRIIFFILRIGSIFSVIIFAGIYFPQFLNDILQVSTVLGVIIGLWFPIALVFFILDPIFSDNMIKEEYEKLLKEQNRYIIKK